MLRLPAISTDRPAPERVPSHGQAGPGPGPLPDPAIAQGQDPGAGGSLLDRLPRKAPTVEHSCCERLMDLAGFGSPQAAVLQERFGRLAALCRQLPATADGNAGLHARLGRLREGLAQAAGRTVRPAEREDELDRLDALFGEALQLHAALAAGRRDAPLRLAGAPLPRPAGRERPATGGDTETHASAGASAGVGAIVRTGVRPLRLHLALPPDGPADPRRPLRADDEPASEPQRSPLAGGEQGGLRRREPLQGEAGRADRPDAADRALEPSWLPRSRTARIPSPPPAPTFVLSIEDFLRRLRDPRP